MPTTPAVPGLRVIAAEDPLGALPPDGDDLLVEGECRTTLARLPDSSVDLIFIDPPYYLQLPKKRLLRWNVRTTVDAVDDAWDQFGSFAEYDAFLTAVLTEAQRVMRPSATIWVIGTYHNIHRVAARMQDLGFWVLNDVIWHKANPMPNFLAVRFTNATETLVWAVRDRKAKGYTFDKQAARSFEGKGISPTVWRIPLCAGRERLRDTKGLKVHATQKPLELLRRVIAVSTKPGAVVLDPMAGTGTTGVAARRLGRRFILIEREPAYVAAARERLAAERPLGAEDRGEQPTARSGNRRGSRPPRRVGQGTSRGPRQ